MVKPCEPHREREQRCGGFALVLTLALLALMVLALYGLSAVVRVNSDLAMGAARAAKARQHALLGLNRAFDELQRLAGPDQRATATADLIAGRHESKRYWTGVWDHTGAHLGWLVSGNNSSPIDALGTSEEFPVVAGPNSSGNVSPMVRVPRVAVTFGSDENANTVSGHFGYWVGDEGVKATLNFEETADRLDFDGASFVRRAADTLDSGVAIEARGVRQMMLPRPRVEEIAASLNPSSIETRAKLARLIAYEQIAEAAAGPVQRVTHFHDLTASSLGVLADAANGGLKIDLSGAGAAEEVGNAQLGHWLSIRPSATSVSGARHGIGLRGPGLSVSPMITELGVRFAFYRNGAAVNAAGGNLALHCQLQVELWNPYTSTLEIPDGKQLGVSIRGLPRQLRVSTGSGQSTIVDLQSAFDQLEFRLPAETTFAPGAIRTFYGGGNWSNTSAGAAGLTLDLGVAIPAAVPALRTLSVVSVSPDEVTELRVNLLSGEDVVASYAPDVAFSAIKVLPATTWGSATSTTNWMFGYGYSVRDAMGFWTDGRSADARSPQQMEQSGTFVEGVATLWRTDPAANRGATISLTSNAAAGITFYGSTASTAPRYMPFELPRQEVISLGALQHLPGVRPNEVGSPWGGAANALFDRAFFSALPRGDPTWDVSSRPFSPNPYLSLYRGVAEPSPGVLFDARKAAEHLMVKGAFNVNSTSEKAWRTLLSGAQIPAGWTVPAELRHAFFRHSHSAQENATAASKPTGVSTAWRQGVRSLNDTGQVDALAAAVVAQIKARGRPFVSLADFLNSGVLDAALDPDVSLVVGLAEAERANINDGSVLQRGMPAFLSQADVVTSIGPCLMSRSDTFRIRAYGDAVNPVDGTREATAVCEAIVQRTPEWIDATRGRRFQIITFRWLAPEDI